MLQERVHTWIRKFEMFASSLGVSRLEQFLSVLQWHDDKLEELYCWCILVTSQVHYDTAITEGDPVFYFNYTIRDKYFIRLTIIQGLEASCSLFSKGHWLQIQNHCTYIQWLRQNNWWTYFLPFCYMCAGTDQNIEPNWFFTIKPSL